MEHLDAFDGKREGVMKQARDMQKMSQQAIYNLQRENIDEASVQIQQAGKYLDAHHHRLYCCQSISEAGCS